MKITPYIIILAVLDVFLCNVDSFWATDTAYKQFFVYDVATFGRIALLASFSSLLMVLHNKIVVTKYDFIIWGLYWAYSLYEFKIWLDYQNTLGG